MKPNRQHKGPGGEAEGSNEVFTMPHRFLPDSGHSSGFWWIPEELKMAEKPANIAIPGVTYSGGIRPFWN